MTVTNTLLACIALAAATLSPHRPASAAETPRERGAYLVNGIVACGNCHTPKGPDGHRLPGEELSGGLVIDVPEFRAVAPNITQDADTGIGKWTDAQIIESIRNGKRPDGTLIGPPMPIPFYSKLSDTDVRAIVAYLRTVKPISRKVEKSTYHIPLPPAYGPPVTHVAEPPIHNKSAYGLYLAQIGHCMDCHAPRVKGQLDMTRAGAGGQELPAFPTGTTVSANLTPANPNGIAHWTNAQVKTAITQGIRPDGRHLAIVMGFDWYKTLTPGDLDDLVIYLRTLKPAKP